MNEQIIDYAPWCLVTISQNKQYITIETYPHEDNNHTPQTKTIWYEEEILKNLRAVFERPLKRQYGKNITVWNPRRPIQYGKNITVWR